MLMIARSTPITLRRGAEPVVNAKFIADGVVQSSFGGHVREFVGVALVTVDNDVEHAYPCAFSFPARELDRFKPEALVATAIIGNFQTSDVFAAQLQARRSILLSGPRWNGDL